MTISQCNSSPFKARSFASFWWLQFIHSLLIRDAFLNISMLGAWEFKVFVLALKLNNEDTHESYFLSNETALRCITNARLRVSDGV